MLSIMPSTLNQLLHSDITSNNHKLLFTDFAKKSFTVANICINIKSKIVRYYYLAYTTTFIIKIISQNSFLTKFVYNMVKKQIFYSDKILPSEKRNLFLH